MKKWSILLIVLLLLVLTCNLANAETKVITATGEYNMGESETLLVAKERAVYVAMQNATEQAGVYIESFTQVNNMAVTKDEIKMIAGGIVEVIDKKYDRKISDTGGDFIKVTLSCKVNTDNVQSMVGKLQDKTQADKLIKIQADYTRAMDEIAALKQQLAEANKPEDKKQIEVRISQNEQNFTAVQWLEKAANMGDAADQIPLLRKAIDLNPQYVEAYSFLIDAYTGQAKIDLLRETIRKLLDLDPNNGNALLKRSVWGWNGDKQAESDYQAGIYMCRQAITTNPTNLENYFNLFIAHIGRKQTDLARSVRTEMMKNNPSSAEAYLYEGRMLELLNDKSALNSFNQAIRLNPYFYKAYYHRAVYYTFFDNFNTKAGIQDYEKCIEIDPRQARPYWDLALTFRSLGQNEEAIRYCKLFIQYAVPDNLYIPTAKDLITELGGRL